MAYRILIVEDEYWTALNLSAEVRDRGGIVVGPTSSVPQAIEFLSEPTLPNAGILDIQLRSDEVFPLADRLRKLGIPFVFATGYEKEEIPSRFADVPHFVKPFDGMGCIETALALAADKTMMNARSA